MSSFASKGRVYYETDFLGAVIPDEVVGTSENSGTAATVAGKSGGVMGLVTGASTGNRSQMTTGLNHQCVDGSIICEFVVTNRTAVTTRALFIGLTDTVSIENPIEISTATITSNADDAVGFVYDTDATNDVWHLQGSKATVDTALKTATNPVTGGTIVPVAETSDEFRIVVSTDGDADFYINGDYVGTVLNAVSTDVLLGPTVLIETRTGGASTAWVDYFSIESGRDQTIPD